MRVVILFPGATEIVAALGGAGSLAAVADGAVHRLATAMDPPPR